MIKKTIILFEYLTQLIYVLFTIHWYETIQRISFDQKIFFYLG